MTPEQKIEALGLFLPPAPPKGGLYQSCLIVDKYIYVSGHGPYGSNEEYITGKVGSEVDQEFGKAAAKQTALAILATLKAHLGELSKIDRLVKTFGMVNCTEAFGKQPYVINGCSELFSEIWGPDKGVGARSAVGYHSLPDNITTEIETVFLLK